jgi:translation initiation factor 1A
MKTKNKRARARRSKKTAEAARTRELVVREDGQAYARVTKLMGSGRLTARCDDGRERMCRIRGRMMCREWVRNGDAVLVSFRSFDDDTADVIHRYDADEVARLERMGEIKAVVINADDDGGGEDDVRFATDSDDDDDVIAAI